MILIKSFMANMHFFTYINVEKHSRNHRSTQGEVAYYLRLCIVIFFTMKNYLF
jgi:hypothetical protein